MRAMSPPAAGPLRVLLCRLGPQRLALLMADVAEVLRAVFITPLPGAPDVVEGIVDVRGVVVPVFDLRRRFALPAQKLSASDRLVLVRGQARPCLLRVDADVVITEVDPARVDDGPALGTRSAVIAGALQLDDGLVLLCDLTAFLQEAEELSLRRALEAHQAHALAGGA